MLPHLFVKLAAGHMNLVGIQFLPLVLIAVPCFNEERPLVPDEFFRLAGAPGIRLVFVDDGATDRTAARLREVCAKSDGKAEVVTLARNGGKAEAVRKGLVRGLERGARVVGFLEADLSTPVGEILPLLREMRNRDASVVIGSRVALLGYQIERKAWRHYVGRVFATVASWVLGLPVYDTQCGAKLFRDTPALREALAVPFTMRWPFDVELLGRLLRGTSGGARPSRAAFVEVPLQACRDTGDSRLGLSRSAPSPWGRDRRRPGCARGGAGQRGAPDAAPG